MKQCKPTLLFFFIALQVFNYVQATTITFIMTAEGQGKTLTEAKASALAELSQQIISKVESSFKSELSVVNDNVDRDTKSIKKIESNFTLKGVQYFNERKNGNEIGISAGLDKAAVYSTIDYLKNQLQVDFSILSLEKKEETLVFSDQLTAFISILPQNILQDFDNIEAWNKNKRDKILKHIYMGKVVFISNSDNYSIKLDEKKIKSGHFLEEGNYEFNASAKSYRSMTGQFYVTAGETVKIKLSFIKNVNNKKISLIIPDKYLFLKTDIQNTLSDLGINIVSDTSNSLVIKIKDSATEVDDYISHQLKVRIEANKLNKRVKKVTLKKNIITMKNGTETTRHNINKLVLTGIVALMSKLDLDVYFSQN